MAEGVMEFGQKLISQGLITDTQFKEALKRGGGSRQAFEEALINLKFTSKEAIYALIADEAGLPYVDLANYNPDSEAIKLVPEDTARKYLLFPLFKIDNVLTIAIADPGNLAALEDVRLRSKCEVDICISSEGDIRHMIDESYHGETAVKDLIESMDEGAGATPLEAEAVGMADLSGKAPITKLVNLIVTQAVRDRASDIHIEPDAERLRIRFRIDGILYDVPAPPKHLQGALISRIKVLGNLDIAETRAPQDGHFKLHIDNQDIDTRISTIPTISGENLVLRLLNAQRLFLGMDQLGFPPEGLKGFETLIRKPYGIVLTTGPTGSGKTTTLYAALSRLNSVERNILTIEDPVEYRLAMVRQIQVNPKAGLTFATGLRSMLRQDPDIIMVGEIRDLDTANIAVQSALTGHLVLSSLHTNDAAGALTRLVDMGVEPFLVASSVTGVIAQRLVRLVCPRCKESYKPAKGLLKELGLGEDKDVLFYRGKGCNYCKGTGYRGRIGIFELMTVDNDIRQMITDKIPTEIIKRKAEEKGMKALGKDGLHKAIQGITSIEEVLRVTEALVELAPEEKPASPIAAKEGAMRPPVAGRIDIEDYQKRMENWLTRRR